MVSITCKISIFHNRNLFLSAGFYKVRGVDVFNETSPYSQIVEYLEL